MRSSGHTLERGQVRLASLLVLAASFLFTFAGPVEAQVTTVETVPPVVDADGRTASERIDQVVVLLRVLGAVLVVGAAGFWWRTRPSTVERLTVTDSDIESTEVV